MTPALRQTIVHELERGPRPVRELAQACGLDPEDVAARRCLSDQIRVLNHQGVRIHNALRRGSHGGAVYVLGRRRCQHAGCITILSDSNQSIYCRRHLSLHVSYLDLLIEALTMDVGGEVEIEMPGQLSLLPAPVAGAGRVRA